MRRNFAQILKDAKIDIKVEYQKLYGMLYDRSIQVSNTNRISVYDELSTYFIAFHFRGTCLSLDEFNDLHGFHFEKDPTNFNIDHLISLCEYIENLLIAYQCVSLSYPYVHVLLGKHADTGNVVRNQTAHAGDSAVLTSMYSAMRRS